MQKFLLASAAVLAMCMAGIAFTSSDALAQGTVGRIEKRGKVCPSDYAAKENDKYCVPQTSKSSAVYHAPQGNKCAAGYFFRNGWCIEDKKASSSTSSSASSSSSSGRSNAGSAPQPVGITLAKANPLQLCPSGYRTSGDNKSCQTIFEGAPAARAKGAGSCNAGEIEEFGAWCTSTETALTAEQMKNATRQDFNRIYTQNGSKNPVPERAGYVTPLMELKQAEAGPVAVASESGAQGSVQQASVNTGTPAQGDPCAEKPKKKGLGRALGGAVGVALGAAVDAAEGC